jgi:heptosyltransferase-2
MKILAMSFSGIGNSLMAAPFLNRLQRLTGTKIDVLCLNPAIAESLRLTVNCENIYILPRGVMAALFFVLGLRRNEYDACVTLFPSNKWQFNLIAFLTGAKKRVTHHYLKGNFLGFLQNCPVDADKTLHDVEQNCLLLKAFGVDFSFDRQDASLKISDSARVAAKEFFQKNILSGKAVGVHPGGGGDFNAHWQGAKKRWPVEKFALLCDSLIKTYGVKIVLFGGGGEDRIKKTVKALSTRSDAIYFAPNADLGATAALMEKCALFISNDSGLMHLAVLTGVPVVGIFGPTNFNRTAPWRSRNYIVRSGEDCSPCLKYPFSGSNSRIHCANNFVCFDKVGPEDVLGVVKDNNLLP